MVSIIYILILVSLNVQAYEFLDITHYGYEQYQDIVINNEIVKKSTYPYLDCDTRYQIIKHILDQYKRPFTVLDIGASQGYYSFRIAYDYDSVCVMIEANNPDYPLIADQLLDLCKANKDLNNIIFLNHLFKPDELQHLSECEHFDVVLALNILHIFGEDWQQATDAILNMADYVIIEIPPQETNATLQDNQIRKNIEDYIISKGAYSIGIAPRQSAEPTSLIYLIESQKTSLQRKTWLLPLMTEKKYIIESSFTHKTLTKKSWPPNTYYTSQWVPGINLLTFKMCHGTWPTKETLKTSLELLKEYPHTDWMINNMILQGNNLSWIDIDDAGRKFGGPTKVCKFSPESLHAHQEMMDIDDPNQIEHYFWNYLIRVPIHRYNLVHFIGNILPASSLVFYINPQDDNLIFIYLGYGAKVICFDCFGNNTKRLLEKFEDEEVVITNQQILGNSQFLLNTMVDFYRSAHLCTINLPENDAYSLIQNLSQPIPYLIFKFNMQQLEELKVCLNHLIDLGYTEFNFSPRQLPLFALNKNRFTQKNKDWATSIETLFYELHEFAQLDHENDFWGYIYAHYSKELPK